MPKLQRHKAFLKDYDSVRLTHKQFEKLVTCLNCLKEGLPLPSESKDHPLKGNWKDFRECHLGGDTLLIYRHGEEVIVLARLGTHSDLFG